ncbi:MAG TPA: hypothetical protein VFQ53_20695 [Kofleriaceae bacterium]|nr:hypothetical protein [Kofleriaceae bacterium]
MTLVLVLAACDGGGMRAGFDNPDGHCAQMLSDLETATVDRGSCTSVLDCQVIGGALDESSCSCAAFALACGGVPIGRNAPHLPLARTLFAQLQASCTPDIGGCSSDELPCECECAPIDQLDCVDGRCVGTASQTCTLPPEPLDGGF